tara:strand:- start:1056 stop:1211 length:156 start_codon:yes stop_codon:yes gene_type:complete
MESKLKQKSIQKNCYGTNEWSANSGICCNCKWQEECGKFERKLKSKKLQTK